MHFAVHADVVDAGAGSRVRGEDQVVAELDGKTIGHGRNAPLGRMTA